MASTGSSSFESYSSEPRWSSQPPHLLGTCVSSFHKIVHSRSMSPRYKEVFSYQRAYRKPFQCFEGCELAPEVLPWRWIGQIKYLRALIGPPDSGMTIEIIK